MSTRARQWTLVGLLFLLSVINYVDRQALSILAPTIQADLGLSDRDYGQLLNLFLLAYTISYLVSGRIMDAVGTRIGLTCFVAFWSTAQILTGWVGSLGGLGFCRFLLGLGEAGGYTASPKAVAESFAPKDRGLAVGIYGAGASVGATVAPLMLIAVAANYGWRAAFFVTGIAGLVLGAVWFVFYRRPVVAPVVPAEPAIAESTRWKWIVQRPGIWALVAARLLTDPVWYFFQFWMPKYLHDARGLDQQNLTRTWLIYLAADVGFVASGLLAPRLIRNGRTPRQARLGLMLGCACLVPLAPLIVTTSSNFGVFALSMVVVLAHTAWLASITTYAVDYIPGPLVGTAFGFVAAGSAVGGMLMNAGVVWLIAHGSYNACFFVMPLLYPGALFLLWRYTRQDWVIAPAQAGRV